MQSVRKHPGLFAALSGILTEKLPKITTAHWDILPLHIEFQGAHRV